MPISEQTKKPPELKCPDCDGEVKYYHCTDGSRVVCREKCKGWKVIFSMKKWDNDFQEGDVL